MAIKKAVRPTGAELDILHVLWKRGPSTVRGVHEIVGRESSTRYTTTLKLLQNMTEKSLVARDESRHAHIYKANVPQERTLRELAGDLLDRAFGGSAESLVMHALKARKVTPEEAARIRKMLEEVEGGKARGEV